MSGYRKERLEKQIRMIVADSLLKDVKDPRIGFVTVTDANLNRDKTAVVISISVMGDEKAKRKTMMGLNSAKGFFQFQIGKVVKMRNTPKVVFKLDSSIEEGVEMVGKIMDIEDERIHNEKLRTEDNKDHDNENN